MFEKKEKSSLINKITTSFRKVILLKVVCGVWYDWGHIADMLFIQKLNHVLLEI